MENEFLSHCTEVEDLAKLPERGMEKEMVLEEAKKIISLGHTDWKTGSESGTVYNGMLIYFTNLGPQVLNFININKYTNTTCH